MLTIFGVILCALLSAFQVQSTKMLNVGGLVIFTDQTMPYGSQNRGYSPLERQASMLWGAHHFNNRDGSMVKEIASAEYMDGCDIQLNFSFFDIGKTQEGAIQAYREATILNPSHPAKVLVADIWSSRTKTLCYIGKVDKIVINSGSATSDELDLFNDYPYFTRTIPPDSAVSEAAVKFLQNQGFDKIGCVYVNDSYGIAFKNGVVLAAAKFGIDSYSSPVLSDYSTNPVEAILDESNGLVNAWIGVIFTSDLEPVMRDALLAGAAGGDNVWVYTDGMNEYDFVQWSAGGGNYDKCQDGGNSDCDDILDALNGAFRIVATGGALTANGGTLFDQFDASWHALDSDSDFQKLLAEKSLKKDVTGNIFISDGNPSYTIDGFGVPIPNGTDMSVYNETFFQHSDLSQYESFFFDSAVQVGLGACKALSDNGDDFSVDASSVEEMEVFADKLIVGMTSITFEGWSGKVVFDDKTGSRTPTSTLFDIRQSIYDPSDMSLSLVKVCDWSIVREIPFNFECATCVPLRYSSGLSTAPPQRKEEIIDHTVTAQWIGLIGKIALLVFASTFLVVYLRAACGALPHIAKMHIYYHIQLAYSVFDWYLDMESSANMYESGSASSGFNALLIMVVNAVVSVFFILRVYKFEKSKGNFDFDLFKKETIMMAFVQFTALTNIKIMMYGPWITTLYRGHSSRYAFMVFNIVPLLTENIPQFLNQAYYLSARADRDTLTLRNVTVISTIMSALAIIGTGLKALSTVFMEGDQKMGIDKLFDREIDGIERDISKKAFAEHLADQYSSAQQLARMSLNSTKVTPVDGDPPTREEIKELEEGLKVKGNDVMVFKKNVLQELLNDVLKKTREREREQERERLKEATAGMAKQNPHLLTEITRHVEERRRRATLKGAQGMATLKAEDLEKEREAEEIEGQDRQPQITLSWRNTLSPVKKKISQIQIKNLNF